MFPLSLAPSLPLQATSPGDLERARAGDARAVEALIATFGERIFHLALQILRDREAAEDAAQEIWVRALEKLPRFRGESAFGTWLYRLAINFCLGRKRTQTRRSALAPCPDEAEPQTEFTRQLETRLALETVLDQLPENLALTLMLREWHGCSYDEIAAITRVPAGTVRSRLHKARAEFMRLWREGGHE